MGGFEMENRSQQCGSGMRGVMLMVSVALLSGITAMLSSWLLKHYQFGAPLRLVVALLPVPAFVWLFIALFQGTRSLDEMMQRITLEALAFSFIGTALVVVTYGYLERAGFVPHENWSQVWPIMVGLYIIGYIIAWRRYR
jgi:hypothetical protein